jgi:hypothetical protein
MRTSFVYPQGDFAAVMNDGFNFAGTFACGKIYDIGSVPNPCLKLDGPGVVGVPLSERDAQAIIFHSSKVRNGEWEMSSEKVRAYAE